jgi:hypothetical protein
MMRFAATAAVALSLLAPMGVHANPGELRITRAGSQTPGQGPAEYFTGSVRVDPLFPATAPSRMSGGLVTFEPGARSCSTCRSRTTTRRPQDDRMRGYATGAQVRAHRNSRRHLSPRQPFPAFGARDRDADDGPGPVRRIPWT